MTAMSNLCQGSALESFTTFTPTEFFSHNSSAMNLTIIADTFWGLRDLRVVYRVCEASCLTCTSDGCQQCQGIL